MLKVRNTVRRSQTAGKGQVGVYTREAIQPGQSVWEWVQGFDARFTVMPKHPVARQFVKKYSFKPFYDSLNYYLSNDNMRFINHSWTPNLVAQSLPADPPEKGLKQHLVAARYIEAGEELTISYPDNYLTDDPGSQQFYR